jgi:hypothetical protein
VSVGCYTSNDRQGTFNRPLPGPFLCGSPILLKKIEDAALRLNQNRELPVFIFPHFSISSFPPNFSPITVFASPTVRPFPFCRQSSGHQDPNDRHPSEQKLHLSFLSTERRLANPFPFSVDGVPATKTHRSAPIGAPPSLSPFSCFKFSASLFS